MVFTPAVSTSFLRMFSHKCFLQINHCKWLYRHPYRARSHKLPAPEEAGSSCYCCIALVISKAPHFQTHIWDTQFQVSNSRLKENIQILLFHQTKSFLASWGGSAPRAGTESSQLSDQVSFVLKLGRTYMPASGVIWIVSSKRKQVDCTIKTNIMLNKRAFSKKIKTLIKGQKKKEGEDKKHGNRWQHCLTWERKLVKETRTNQAQWQNCTDKRYNLRCIIFSYIDSKN